MPDSEPTVQELFDLTGRTALITGASGWLGTSFARGLAEAGASVVVGSRVQARAEQTAAKLPGSAAHHGVELDQMDETSCDRGFKAAVKAAGKIDILVNNGNEAPEGDIWNTTGESFSRVQLNATAYFLLARMLRDHAVDGGRPASVVMLGSMYGVVGSYPDAYEGVCGPSPVAYHALKGGIIHMTRHLAVYWAKDRVRVNCLSPGPFPSDTVPAELPGRLSTKCPMARMGRPHELKGALMLLASDAGSYITGQNILVDGGWTAW